MMIVFWLVISQIFPKVILVYKNYYHSGMMFSKPLMQIDANWSLDVRGAFLYLSKAFDRV